MKIGYFADGAWSHKAIELISNMNDFEIVFIVPRFDIQDPILKELSNILSVPFLPIKNINSKETVKILSSYGADIFVSMSFNQIVKKPLLKLTKHGFINCHAGKLPFYRGCNVLNWVLINGEKEFGVTVHYMDEGIDTGDIISQELSEITDTDDYSTILDKATQLCANTLHNSLMKIKNSNVTRIKQSTIHKNGSYCRRRVDGDEWIDWTWSNLRIFNFVRAITKPGPYARTTIDNELILIHKVSIFKINLENKCSPGEIILYNGDILVRTSDGFIKINKFSFKYNTIENHKKIITGSMFKNLKI
tara:strand:- start:23024 stop:23938 length:915 start_codon:yes stop_codon:yes gene_type:complete